MKTQCLLVCKMHFFLPGMATVSGLLQLCVLVSFVMVSHSQIKLISENLCHSLTWEARNQTTIPMHYRVQYKSERLPWINHKECFDTIHLSCDLTEELRDPKQYYCFRVQGFTENGTLLWEEEDYRYFLPVKSTILGPPTVHVAGCDRCLVIAIQPPVCQPKSPDKRTSHSLVQVYHELTYEVTLIKAGIMNEAPEILEFATVEENFTTTIQQLLPRTNYCISVNASATVNLGQPAKPSPWKCAVTGPLSEQEQDPYVPAVIFGVLLTSGILALLIILWKGGFICLKRTPVPKSLSDFSTLEHVFSKDQQISEPLTSVKVEFKGMKKRVQNSEDDETNSEDDEGYPAYTHHFGGGVTSSHEHSSASTGISGDSVLGERSNQEGTPLHADEVGTEVHQLILNENESVDSVRFAPILEETRPLKLLENCTSFNVNLNSVLLSDSVESWKECGASQVPLLQDLETSFTAHADGALQSNLLCDMTDWPGLPETCTLNETTASSDSKDSDSDVSQDFGYMRRK